MKNKWEKESVVIFDPNIAYEEDIEEAVKKCKDMFGPIGRYIYPNRNGITSGIIYTPKFGKLWYGDIDKEGRVKLENLQSFLNDEVSIIYDN